MKKEKVKVLVPNAVHRFTEVRVTDSTPEIYHITFVYAHDIVREEIYLSFRDEDDMYSYCYEKYKKSIDCIHFFWELISKVEFGGNDDEE